MKYRLSLISQFYYFAFLDTCWYRLYFGNLLLSIASLKLLIVQLCNGDIYCEVLWSPTESFRFVAKNISFKRPWYYLRDDATMGDFSWRAGRFVIGDCCFCEWYRAAQRII